MATAYTNNRSTDDNPFNNTNGNGNYSNAANGSYNNNRVSPNNPNTIRVPSDNMTKHSSSNDQAYALNVKDQDSPPSSDYATTTPSKGRNLKEKAKIAASNEVWWGIFVVVVLVAAGAIGMLIYESTHDNVTLAQFEDPQHEQIIICIVAGVFGGIASIITIIQIIHHWQNWVHAPSQRRVIRILALVPVYGILSFLSCIFLDVELYFQAMIDCYEAYVVYCFLILLTKYLGGHKGVAQTVASKGTLKWVFPLNWCFKPATANERWVWWIKWSVLQYCWVAVACAFATLVTNVCGVYKDGVFSATDGYLWVTVAINISQCIALYALVWLYQATKQELRPFHPVAKFLAVKALVFFTFWQSVLISGLAYINVLHDQTCDTNADPSCHGNPQGFTVTEEKVLLESVLICVEVFCFAIAHHWVFSFATYKDGTYEKLMRARALAYEPETRQNIKDPVFQIDGPGNGVAEPTHNDNVEMMSRPHMGRSSSGSGHAL